jgi:hypothetical protein
MVANIIKNIHPIQPMRWGKMHSRGQIVFLRVGVGAWGNLMFPLCSIWLYHVPTKFPKFSMCSQHVPNSTTSFAQTSPLVTYKEKPTIYIFWECLKSDLNFSWWANQGGPLSKSEKKFEHLRSPQLSNMNHTILYTLCNEWHVEHNYVQWEGIQAWAKDEGLFALIYKINGTNNCWILNMQLCLTCLPHNYV